MRYILLYLVLEFSIVKRPILLVFVYIVVTTSAVVTTFGIVEIVANLTFDSPALGGGGIPVGAGRPIAINISSTDCKARLQPVRTAVYTYLLRGNFPLICRIQIVYIDEVGILLDS